MNTTGRRVRGSIVIILLVVLAACVLFGGYSTTADAPGWLRMVSIEIQAACRDAGTQWMVVICLLSYLVVFLFLERRSLPQVSTKNAKQTTAPPTSDLRPLTSISARLVPFCGKNSDVWLIVFVALVLLRYAVDYTNAARSLQVVVLLTGIVVGKGIGLWAKSRGTRVESREPEKVGRGSPLPAVGGASVPASQLVSSLAPPEETGAQGLTRPTVILCIITFLLAVAALWQPERGMEFQYRGQRRWTGVWDNPNTYGVLMGVGFTLAVGIAVQRLRSKDSSREAEQEGEHSTLNIQHSTSNEVGRVTLCAPGNSGTIVGDEVTSRSGKALLTSCPTINHQLKTIHYAQCLLFLVAASLCAYGLVKSYSRGAWLGTAVGIGWLMWKWINREPREIHEKLTREKPSTFNFQPSTLRLWLPISVLLTSILVLSFWQFRHTESPLLRRVFSVGNPNDFSWRNRVTAWQGAGRMILDKPIIGFGWGKAEEIYSKEYRAARLEESAAVQLNDYLMIGISAGVPALACLIAYLWLALSLRSNAQSLKLGNASRESKAESRELDGRQTSVIAASGAMVLLIGFWFDGGLFKLPTCVVFWVLLEMCRRRGNESHGLTTMPVGGASVLASRLVSSLAPPIQCGAQRTARPTINSQPSTLNFLHWLAGLFAFAALGLTALHLGTPQLVVSERTLNIARKFLVPGKEKADFEYLAAMYSSGITNPLSRPPATLSPSDGVRDGVRGTTPHVVAYKSIWSNTPLKTLLQHAHLANYNRTLVNWKLEDQLYREFVLSPEIVGDEVTSRSPEALLTSCPTTAHAWRRPLWEYFYPRIRKESSLEAAAEIVVRHLSETCRRRGDETNTVATTNSTPDVVAYKSISEIWRQRVASVEEFERIYVAALRSAGMPSRLATSGQAEFWSGAEWKPAPRPIEVNPKVD